MLWEPCQTVPSVDQSLNYRAIPTGFSLVVTVIAKSISRVSCPNSGAKDCLIEGKVNYKRGL